MGIFDRISRIAKSEYNDLKRRLAGDDDETKPKDRHGETVDIDGEAGWPAEKWPRHVRESYAALELPLGSDADQVKKKYRDLLKRYHPDKHASSEVRSKTANELTAALGQHKETVLDFLKKKQSR